MTAHAIRAAVLLAALSAVGCGTAANLVGAWPGQKRPFGGVHRDVQCLTQARDGELAVANPLGWEPGPHQQKALMVLCALDLPLTLVGDVLTYPYARAYTYINQPTDYPAIAIAPPPPGAVPFTPVGPPGPAPRPQPAP